jgi:class 3 adenylate cyclase
VHTGEVDLLDDAVAGTCLDVAEALASLARPAEILVTRTVKDLVTGSGIVFADRGSHSIGPVPGRSRLYSIAGQ